MYTPQDISLRIVRGSFVRVVSFTSAVNAFAFMGMQMGWIDGPSGDASAQRIAATDASTCGAAFDPDAHYPLLPETAGADVQGEAGVVVHLQHHRGVVELDDCLYELDRPLEIDFAGFDAVSLLLEIHDPTSASSGLFVTVAGTVETVEIETPFLVFTMSADPSEELGFELASPGQAAPTVPVLIAKPVDDGPPPK